MITEDQGLTMLATANPVPDEDAIHVDAEAAAYLVTLHRRSSEMTQVKTKPEPKQEQTRRPLIPALVLVAAAILIGVVTILSQQDDAPPPATEPVVPELTGERSVEEALAVATTARDEAVPGVGNSMALAWDYATPFGTPLERQEQAAAWFAAVGMSTTLGPCEVFNDDLDNVTILCSHTENSPLLEVEGSEPLEVGLLLFVKFAGDEHEGEILRTTTVVGGDLFRYEKTRFADEILAPFRAWIDENHPEAIDTMYVERLVPDEFDRPSFEPASIELWAKYTAEYLNDQR